MSGIDFHQALEILSARASSALPVNENRSPESATATATSSCPCCVQPIVPDSVKQLGQVLELYSSDNEDDSPVTESYEEVKAQQQELDETRRRRHEELQRELQAMAVPDLLRAVVAAQQQRVVAYKSYDRGLETVLHTRNLALYPAMVAEATASFAVLSDTINAIQKQLGSHDSDSDPADLVRHGRDELKDIVHRLQSEEQRKLSLTAALHLEQIRLQGVEESADAATTRRLLEEGVQSLKCKVSAIVESINNVMDDLQCAIVEESEHEG